MPDLNPLMKTVDRGAERAKHLVEFGAEKLVPKGTLGYGQYPLTEEEQWRSKGQAWMNETPEQKAQRASELIQKFPDQGADLFDRNEKHMQRLQQKFEGAPLNGV